MIPPSCICMMLNDGLSVHGLRILIWGISNGIGYVSFGHFTLAVSLPFGI